MLLLALALNLTQATDLAQPNYCLPHQMNRSDCVPIPEPLCPNFSGIWTGACSTAEGPIGMEYRTDITQSGCQSFIIDGAPLAFGGYRQEEGYVPDSSSPEAHPMNSPAWAQGYSYRNYTEIFPAEYSQNAFHSRETTDVTTFTGSETFSTTTVTTKAYELIGDTLRVTISDETGGWWYACDLVKIQDLPLSNGSRKK